MGKYLSFIFLVIFISICTTSNAQNGCTDINATNYNALAIHNDGSCVYPTITRTPSIIGQLSDTIKETSGLVFWNGYLWTPNDDSDTAIYAIDTADGHIVKRITITGAANNDWEEISQDQDYLYVGDFGNNGNGNRTNLSVLRISKAQIVAGQTTLVADKIDFSYADQTNFSATGSNNTDYDCEAFIVTNDSIYLFTKQWISGKTKIYRLPKIPGNYVATPAEEYNIDGLVTGATYLPEKRTVLLCGYKKASAFYQPFVCLLYDFAGNNFFYGNKRKILINPLFYQVEGIATIDGKRFFLSNENRSPITQALRSDDLGSYLANFYQSLGVKPPGLSGDNMGFYPNPSNGQFRSNIIAKKPGEVHILIYNTLGQLTFERKEEVHTGKNEICFATFNSLKPGVYWIKMVWDERISWGKVEVR